MKNMKLGSVEEETIECTYTDKRDCQECFPGLTKNADNLPCSLLTTHTVPSRCFQRTEAETYKYLCCT